MTTQSIPFTDYLPPLASFCGLLALGGGIYGLSDPISWSRGLGLPAAKYDVSNAPPNATSSNNVGVTPGVEPYLALAASRNVGSGLTILALYGTGNRKALGVVLGVGSLVALIDAMICNQYAKEEGKASGHAVMGGLTAVLGYALYYY